MRGKSATCYAYLLPSGGKNVPRINFGLALVSNTALTVYINIFEHPMNPVTL